MLHEFKNLSVINLSNVRSTGPGTSVPFGSTSPGCFAQPQRTENIAGSVWKIGLARLFLHKLSNKSWTPILQNTK